LCVKSHPLVKRNFVASRDLPQTGQARFGGEDDFHQFLGTGVFFDLLGELALQISPGADHAHVAAQDVVELGELVNGQRPQNPTQRSDPGIVFGLEFPVHLFEFFEQFFVSFVEDLVGTDDHGAEFVHIETAAILANPTVAIDDGAGRAQDDENGDGQPDRHKDDAQSGGNKDVEEAFGGTVGVVHSGLVLLIFDGVIKILDFGGFVERTDQHPAVCLYDNHAIKSNYAHHCVFFGDN